MRRRCTGVEGAASWLERPAWGQRCQLSRALPASSATLGSVGPSPGPQEAPLGATQTNSKKEKKIRSSMSRHFLFIHVPTKRGKGGEKAQAEEWGAANHPNKIIGRPKGPHKSWGTAADLPPTIPHLKRARNTGTAQWPEMCLWWALERKICL